MQRLHIILTFTTSEKPNNAVGFDSFEDLIIDYIRKKKNGSIVVHVENIMCWEEFNQIVLEVSKRIEFNGDCRIVVSPIEYNFVANNIVLANKAVYSLEVIYF